jgi:hypothetical protein
LFVKVAKTSGKEGNKVFIIIINSNPKAEEIK